MDSLRIGELFAKLKPRILDLINAVGGGAGPFAPTPHDLSSGHHTGSLADAQAPQFLKTDGSRQLVGNLSVAENITIDGVDLSVLKSAYDVHVGLDAATAHGSVGVHTHQNNPQGGQLDHGLALTGLLDDDHTQYAHADGSGTRRAYEAQRLNKSILAGNGLTGGGLLNADRTLSVLLNPSWSGLLVDGNGLRVNTGAAFTWTSDHTFQGLTKTRHLQPELTDTYDLGSSTLLWRKGWLSELDAVVFAQNTVTLLGGWLLISKDEGTIDADVGPADTQIDFSKTMTVGDFVLFRAAGKVEYMQVGSLVSGTTYNVTRNLDGSGADTWAAGTPFAVLGQAGQGRIELNAFDTPRLQMIRQGATYNAQTEIIRIGDLNGNWGYTSQKWGVAIGEYASGKANITIDQDGVLRIRNYTTDIIKLSGTDATLENVLKIAGTSSAIAIGNPPPTSSTDGTGLWIDRTGLYGLNANVRQAYFGSDGKFYAGGGNVRLDSTGINFDDTNVRGIFWNLSGIRIFEIIGYGTSLIRFGGLNAIGGGSNTIMWFDNGLPSERKIYITGSGLIVGQPFPSGSGMAEGNLLVRNYFNVNGNFGVNSEGYIDKSTAIAARVIRTSVQSIPNSTWTAIGFSQATFDDRPSGLSAHWSSGTPTRLTCQVAGVYIISGHISFSANSTGRRVVRILRNGTTQIALSSVNATSTQIVHISLSALLKLSVGDYIELGAYQDSGGVLDIAYDTYSPVLSFARIA